MLNMPSYSSQKTKFSPTYPEFCSLFLAFYFSKKNLLEKLVQSYKPSQLSFEQIDLQSLAF